MCQPDVIPARRTAALVNATAKASATADAAENVPQRVISWKELALHNSSTDAWIAIKGRVYDVTSFAKQHPGGDILFTAAGSDATDVFAAFHTGTTAAKLLGPLCVGRINDPASPLLEHVSVDYVRDVQALRARVHALQLFDSSKLFYLYKLLTNVAICSVSVAIALAFPASAPAVAVAGVIMALFWQQCGWLAHDFLHHQVFRNRTYNNIMGILVGNIFQGYSVNWWKNKHNHHHAVPNVTDAPAGGDPDIATMPVLFWSEKMFEAEDLDDLPRWVLRNQAVLYWPILCMARLSWLTQSLLYQRLPRNVHVTSDAMYAAEVAGLAVHHLWFLGVVARVAYTGSLATALLYMVMAQAFGGLFLGVVFAVGHNAMDVFTEKEMRQTDFVRLQVRSTRNVDPHWFTDWFTGGLSYQVEHHIFPSVPRHHLPTVAKMLREFCLTHSIPYTSETLIEGNRSVAGILESVSKAA